MPGAPLFRDQKDFRTESQGQPDRIVPLSGQTDWPDFISLSLTALPGSAGA